MSTLHYREAGIQVSRLVSYTYRRANCSRGGTQKVIRHTALFECNHCHYGVIGEILNEYEGAIANMNGNFNFSYPDATQQSRSILARIYPVFASLDTPPEHVPEHIGNFFSQGVRALLRSDWDASGMTMRKTLDIS